MKHHTASPETKGWVLCPTWILKVRTKDLEINFFPGVVKTTKGLETEGGRWLNSNCSCNLGSVMPSEPQFLHLYSGEVIPVSQGRCEAKMRWGV